ncbi:Pectinesterase [Rhynchospora pubera]|uniref:pectinesterase n=1 Tax=Rhynchospora pubera TaxID=906938 RepID=A0AAV8G7Y1_9POAL|nr:Pectinesterase [Rhynchospora pubera]
MSTFSDFGPLTERRRAELKQKQRKKMLVAGSSALVVLVVIIAGVAVIGRQPHNEGKGSSTTSSDDDATSTTQMHAISKSVETICAPTDYKDICVKSISKATNASSSPKDMIRAAVSVMGDELRNAFSVSDLLKSEDPRVKQAVADCKEHYENVKGHIASTLEGIDAQKLDNLPTRSYQLRVWLSAVTAYQETCIEGFPDGDLKTKMQNAMKDGKELSSNALAILEKLSDFFSSLNMKIPGLNRRLLSKESAHPEIDEDGIPTWVSEEDRRILLGKVKGDLKPDVVVAKDGSGAFTTINAAINAIPKDYTERYVIYVKEGIYDEQVLIPKKMGNITMIGDGSQKSIITGNKNFVDGLTTYKTATVAVMGDGFMAIAMGFRNTAGAIKHQAVALRVQSDKSIFLNCRMEGFQDTLYAHSLAQYYRSCVITGTIDFLFGDATAVFQNCIFTVRRPLDNQQNIVTAQGRGNPHETTGFVLQKCKIVADPALIPDKAKFKSYLGRPWKEYSHTMIMESEIADIIHPDGFLPWNGDFGLKTLTYREFNNVGPGAATAGRVKWPGYKLIKDKAEATKYTVENFLHNVEWIRGTKTPVKTGFYA